MQTDNGPPLADPRHLDSQYHALARPLYELVNQDPRYEPFPAPLGFPKILIYQSCLEMIARRSIDELELVSCTRGSGLMARSVAWGQYLTRAQQGVVEDMDINELVAELDNRTEDRTVDTPHQFVPDDLVARTMYFYRAIQTRHSLPPLDPGYGMLMCRVLAMGMEHPHQLINRVFPYLLRNPPLGFAPRRPDVYRVLVA